MHLFIILLPYQTQIKQFARANGIAENARFSNPIDKNNYKTYEINVCTESFSLSLFFGAFFIVLQFGACFPIVFTCFDMGFRV